MHVALASSLRNKPVLNSSGLVTHNAVDRIVRREVILADDEMTVDTKVTNTDRVDLRTNSNDLILINQGDKPPVKLNSKDNSSR